MKRVDVVYSLLTNPSKSKVLAVRNVETFKLVAAWRSC